MPYATDQDIIARYGEDLLYQAAPRTPDDAVDAQAVARALADASDEIDASLRGRYTLPLAVVPELLKRLCVDMALALLPTDAAGENDLLVKRAEAARKMLTVIRRGEADLGLAGAAAASAGGAVRFDAAAPVFTRDSLRGL